MARLVDKLGYLKVRDETKPGYHSDGNGLYLQVSVTGVDADRKLTTY